MKFIALIMFLCFSMAHSFGQTSTRINLIPTDFPKEIGPIFVFGLQGGKWEEIRLLSDLPSDGKITLVRQALERFKLDGLVKLKMRVFGSFGAVSVRDFEIVVDDERDEYPISFQKPQTGRQIASIVQETQKPELKIPEEDRVKDVDALKHVGNPRVSELEREVEEYTASIDKMNDFVDALNNHVDLLRTEMDSSNASNPEIIAKLHQVTRVMNDYKRIYREQRKLNDQARNVNDPSFSPAEISAKMDSLNQELLKAMKASEKILKKD